MHDGSWWIGQSVWASVPFAIGAGIIPTLSVIAATGVTTHAVAHWFGARDLSRGLAGLTFEDGDPGAAAETARRWATAYAITAGVALLGVFGSCVADLVPGPNFLVLPGCALMLGLVAVAFARKAGCGLADALGVRDRIPFEQLGTILLWVAAAFWSLAVVTFVLSAGRGTFALLTLVTAPIASIATLLALFAHRDLFLRLAVVIPQIEDFSAAAARAAQKHALALPPHAATKADDLSPIKLVDAPPEGTDGPA